MKLNFAILVLPAASAFNYLSGHHHTKSHHHHSKSAPYGLSNGTAFFGSSGLLTPPTGTAGKAIYSTVVVTNGASYSTIVESASASLNEAGASLPFPSSCTQATVTVTTNATVTVTVPALGSGTSEPVIPTQAPVPTQAGTSSPVESITPSPTETSSSTPLAVVTSALTLAAIGAEPSSSTSTPAVADTPTTVAAAPVVTSTSSTSSTVKAAATPVTAPEESATPASTDAQTPATNSTKSAKRGIIVSGDDTDAITAAFANTKVSWLGNWYSGPPPNLTPEMGMSYVPQLYSAQYVEDGSWASNAKKGVADGDKYFMSFGEPAHSGVTAQTAVTDWMNNMEPYAAQGVSLGTPGNLQNPVDFEWLGTFLDLCETAGCTIGFVCVHWFWTPGPNGQQDFKNAVNNATSLAKGKPVWVDNFEANGDAAGQIEFLTNIIPWLEDNDLVARYGYLAINRTQGGFLPETGNELSDLGKFYATF
ncbi:MAG: hypothetical protein Q9161_002489 [Pseudevernia consocians]